ncbi:MAG: hypothetical protein AAGK23_00365, partial [Pseudomonadota bacterium]
ETARRGVGLGTPKRPDLGRADILLLLWRAKGLMALIFLLIFGSGVLAALMVPTKYVAVSRLLVSPGYGYVPPSLGGREAAAFTPELDALVRTELRLMQSPLVAEQVVQRFGLKRLYPGIAARIERASEDQVPTLVEEGIETLRRDFRVSAARRQSVVRAKFHHEDPRLASEVLNVFLGTYIGYRSEVFEPLGTGALNAQRRTLEADLLAIEEDIRRFLVESGVGDFEAERAATQGLFAAVEEATFENAARLGQLTAQLGVMRGQLDALDAEIDVFVEDPIYRRLAALELERAQLLIRYRETSQPVQEIDRQIARAKASVDYQDGDLGPVRREPNPVYQDTQLAFSRLRSELAAAQQKKAELERQAETIKRRQARITELEPNWQELQRRRASLETTVRNLAERELAARTVTQIAQQGADAIRILEPARQPKKETRLAWVIGGGSFLFAVFAALMAGLVRAFTRQGFATAGSLERTMGLPVVSATR